MEKIYWQFPEGTIEDVESKIPWFKENNKKLDDYIKLKDIKIETKDPNITITKMIDISWINNLISLPLSFNTVGINGTTSKSQAQSGQETHLNGKGIDLGNITVMERRAKRKLISKTLAMLLIPMARADHNWKWEARFTNTLHCQDELTTAGGRSYSTYCKERCCTICLANRKGEKVNLYLPIVEDMPDPHFLTITAQSVGKDGLKIRVHEIAHAIRTLIARYKKRSQRGKGIKFYGIWALESNFNPFKWTYNPHIHMILPSEYAVQTFLNDWMQYWKEREVYVDRKGQYYRRLKKDRQKDLIEIVKYGSKIFTEPDIAKRIRFGLPKKPSFIYVRALYNILLAMDGLDVFNTFGFTLPKRQKPRKMVTKVTDAIDYNYDIAAPDWINEDLGLRLAKYKPTDELEALLQSRVNTDFE
jgi:hypothetical protein